MHSQGAASVPRVADASVRVDVGSLFVPTRVNAAGHRANHREPSAVTTSPTACRIAGLQRQPSFQDEATSGLLLPPQHRLVRPGGGYRCLGVPSELQYMHAVLTEISTGCQCLHAYCRRKPSSTPSQTLLSFCLTVCVLSCLPCSAVAPPTVPVAPAKAATEKPKLRISWAGSGIYFFWQLGAMQYLMNKFHLGKVPMVGASGGGFAAMLSVCEVHPEQVLDTAYNLAMQHNIWERPLGLMGTWGGLVEQWLHDLLPADAAERCRGQVGIVVTQLPFCNQLAITDFKDKTDLINVAMASAHVPMFLVGGRQLPATALLGPAAAHSRTCLCSDTQ